MSPNAPVRHGVDFIADCVILISEDGDMDFLKEIAGPSPLPAGGAAAAYVASLALGLIHKVVLFELKMPGRDTERNLMVVRKEIERLLHDVEPLVKEDPDSYDQFTRSRLAEDKAGMKRRFPGLVDVSMKVIEKSDSALQWIDRLQPLTPRRMIPHLLVASELLLGCMNGSGHVLRANLRSIRDPKKRGNYLRRLDEVLQHGQKRYREVMAKIT